MNITAEEVQQYLADMQWVDTVKTRLMRIEAMKERFKESEDSLWEVKGGRVWKEFGIPRSIVDTKLLRTQYPKVAEKVMVRGNPPVSIKFLKS